MISKEAAKAQLEEIKDFYDVHPEDYADVVVDAAGSKKSAMASMQAFEKSLLRHIEKGRIEFSNGTVRMHLKHSYPCFQNDVIEMSPCSVAHYMEVQNLSDKHADGPLRPFALLAVMSGKPIEEFTALKAPDSNAGAVLSRFLNL